jgi:hypothetical protein
VPVAILQDVPELQEPPGSRLRTTIKPMPMLNPQKGDREEPLDPGPALARRELAHAVAHQTHREHPEHANECCRNDQSLHV